MIVMSQTIVMSQEITTLIQTTGFPIFAFLLLAWYINKQGERHDEEMNNMIKSYEENTKILVALKEMLEKWGGE